MKYIQPLLLGMLLLVSELACAEEEASPNVIITKASGPISGFGSQSLKIKPIGHGVEVAVSAYFYTENPFLTPWLTQATPTKWTLHIGTRKNTGWFQTKDEYFRTLIMKIEPSSLPKGAILNVYNEDTGEFLGERILP